MLLNKLSLLNFKNYEEVQLEFDGGIQYFLGKNGSGKTNLLDAIHYLSFTKSAISASDNQHIRSGESQFLIKGEFTKGTQHHQVACSFQQGMKKIIREDEQECVKLSTHIGKYPVVLVAPNDIELIWDGSELRRKFFDSLLSQIDKNYLENLIQYVQYLKQRNSLLKLFSERGSMDRDMLDAYDQKMIPAGNYIHLKRREFMVEFLPVFHKHYQFLIGDSAEAPQILYRTELDEVGFKDLLVKNLQRDVLMQRTCSGIHRDDFQFLLNDFELKKYGSQGQQKSFLVALKLAEFQIISQRKGLKPLLLLDDIFDKLDDERIHKLMMLVADNTFGQLFITDARVGRSKEVLKHLGISATLFEVKDGTLSKGNGKK
jgi:DNA replication and repair protein RecF